jgi:hypothetical protein
MSRRMNWDKLRYRGKPTLSIRDEEEQVARADRWLRARRRKQQSAQYSMNLRRPVSTNAGSTGDVPW